MIYSEATGTGTQESPPDYDGVPPMSDDPDEVRYEQEAAKRDPATATAAIEAIEVHLRYGIPGIKFQGWIIIVLLGLILWRVW